MCTERPAARSTRNAKWWGICWNEYSAAPRTSWSCRRWPPRKRRLPNWPRFVNCWMKWNPNECSFPSYQSAAGPARGLGIVTLPLAGGAYWGGFWIRLTRGCWWVRRLRIRDNEPVDPAWLETLNELRRRLEISRPVRLLKSALVEVPTVIGWLRPVILLPAASLTGLTPSQLEAILAHELAHVRRLDYVVGAFQCLVETLMFYHPAVWWISRCVREERENCCDDLVVKVCGDRLAYARALATL